MASLSCFPNVASKGRHSTQASQLTSGYGVFTECQLNDLICSTEWCLFGKVNQIEEGINKGINTGKHLIDDHTVCPPLEKDRVPDNII